MGLTVYFKRSDAEGLASARLCLGIARAVWRDHILNMNAPQLNDDTRRYLKELAAQLEFYAKNALQPQKGETRLMLMGNLREAHRSARTASGSNVSLTKFVSVWKEILKRIDGYYAFGTNERLKHDQWYCWRKELAEPGPVLRTFFGETEAVVNVLQSVYEDAVGPLARVHANVEIETIPTVLPSQAGSGMGTRQLVRGRLTSERNPHHEFNPSPKTDFMRARRIVVEVPYPCDYLTAFAYEWVVAHEIGVHLFSQLANKKGPLKDGRYLAFSEGFMDAVILDVMKDSVNGVNLVPNGVGADIVRGARLRAKHRVSNDLPHDMTMERKVAWRDEVPAGIECWQHLKNLATSIDEDSLSGEAPQVWARRVGLKLNILDLDKTERAVFINGMQIIFDVSGDPLVQQQMRAQQGQLAEYLSDMLEAESLEDAAAVVRECLDQTAPFAALSA